MNTLDSDVAPAGGLMPGAVFGRYTIVRCIGAGGMGAVYEAIHDDLKKRVALKTLHRVVAADPVARARFLREARAASRIRHPHVVDVSDVGVVDELPYLVMEHLDGESLGARFRREVALEPEALIELLLPVLAALDAVHEGGVVHRDLKPENIFLARTRDRAVAPKVLDFGISKLTDAEREAGVTASSSTLGTPFYMAPEQATDARRVDARADLYAIGVILYEGLTGSVPYRGDNLFTVLTAASKGGCAPPRSLRASIPEALDAVVLRAMAVSPDDRFPDAPSLARALLPFASSAVRARWSDAFGASPAPAPAPPPAPANTRLPVAGQPRPPAEPARARPTWVVGALALVAVVLVGAFALRRRDDTPATPPRAANAPSPRPTAAPPEPAAPRAVESVTVATADAGAPVVHAPLTTRPMRSPHRQQPARAPGSAPAAPVATTNEAPIVE